MGNYSNGERETIIRYDDESKLAVVNTFNHALQRKLEKMLKEYPEDVKLVKDYAKDDYDGIYVTMPKSWIRIQATGKRIYTPEQLEKLRENMRRVRASTIDFTVQNPSTLLDAKHVEH